MQFERIEIRNLRRLREPVCIEGLQPGLNVLAGDNEEGKSTVLAALRCALFDRHNLTGREADSLQPHNSSLRPEVELSFRLAQASYRLRKAFVQKPEVELEGPDLHRTGPAAEEALRELLAFEVPGRGASKPKHQGLWGLLWVEQGTAFQHLEHNDRSRSVLQTTLEAEVGDVLGGRHGQALLERIATAYGEFYTATGKPRGAYKQAEEQVAQLEARLDELRRQLAGYDEEVDRLQRLEEDIARFRADGTLDGLRRRHEQAGQAAEELAGLKTAVTEAERALQIARLEQEAPQQRWTQREALRRQLAQARTELEALAGREQQALAAREQAEARGREAEQALAAARQRVSEARAGLERSRASVRRQELRQLLAERGRRLREAELAAAAAARAEADAAAAALPAEAVAELRALEQELLRAEAALQAGATRVELALEVAVSRDGEPLAGDARFAVSARTELALEGVGRLTLEPGGADLARAREQRRELEQAYQARLAELQLRDASEGEARLARQRELEQQAEHQHKVLAAHAPEGLEALRAELAAAERELGEQPPAEELSDAGAARAAVEAAQRALGEAEAAEEQVSGSTAVARETQEQARAAAVEVQALRGEKQAQAERLGEELGRAQAEQDDDALYAAMTRADKAAEQAEARRREAEAALAAAEPERIELELEAARDAVEAAARGQAEREQAARELRIRLQSSGQREAGEQAAELEAELTQAQVRAEHLQREANAVRVLHEVLQAAARDARETFLGPVMERVQPYLRLLIPEAELVLDAQLGLLGLRRDGVEEPFESLSIGTREQLAIIVRLAFADLLADQDQPVAVILDDALVYADDGRMQRMQLVLRRAAKRFQILVLTCRERDYLGIGVPIIRLADCRQSAPVARVES